MRHVYAQLVRAAGDGMQRQKGGAFPAPENGKFGDGLLAAHIDDAQEAAAAELASVDCVAEVANVLRIEDVEAWTEGVMAN